MIEPLAVRDGTQAGQGACTEYGGAALGAGTCGQREFGQSRQCLRDPISSTLLRQVAKAGVGTYERPCCELAIGPSEKPSGAENLHEHRGSMANSRKPHLVCQRLGVAQPRFAALGFDTLSFGAVVTRLEPLRACRQPGVCIIGELVASRITKVPDEGGALLWTFE